MRLFDKYEQLKRSFKRDPKKEKEKKKRRNSGRARICEATVPIKKGGSILRNSWRPIQPQITTLTGDDVNPKPSNFSHESQAWKAHYMGTRHKQTRIEEKRVKYRTLFMICSFQCQIPSRFHRGPLACIVYYTPL